MMNPWMHVCRVAVCVLFLHPCCKAQETVAPTPEHAGPSRGDDWRGYNIVNSFETGYRFVGTSGNANTYRSNENFGDGVRLLSSFFTINSKAGHGRLFDEIVFTTEGLGGDPYSSAKLRVQKNRLYEYNLQWRRSAYFNPGLVTDAGAGVHLLNTSYTLQDHDLTLFPQSRLRVLLGYTRDSQSGPGISSAQLFNSAAQFDPSGNAFAVFTNVKRLQTEYRLGAEVRWLGFTLSGMRGWQDFKDDTSDQFSGSSHGDDFNNNAVLNFFSRSQPDHGTSPYWRAALFRNDRLLNVNGRFTYTNGRQAFLANETAVGTNQVGAAANQQVLTAGDARRPIMTGNVTASVFPTEKLTVTNQTSFYSIKTDGNSAYLLFNNANQAANLLYFQYLGIRTASNSTDLQYHLYKWLDINAGYDYSNRRIVSSPQLAIVGSAGATPYVQTNELNSGILGFRLRPIKGLTITAGAETGRATRPFTQKSDGNISALTGRVEYKRKNLQLTASTATNYNENSAMLSTYSSHSRIYTASASWSPRDWLSFDTSYSRLHIDSLGGIQFFVGAPSFLLGSQLFQNQLSYYISNINSGTLGIRMSPFPRLDLYLGYSRVEDAGDGRGSPIATTIGPSIDVFRMAQTFPLRFQSPLARMSFRISERVRWNFGYQYYGYHADFSPNEDYHANTGYTSISWSF